MIEILIVIALARRLSADARKRDRPAGWAALGVAFWIFGELGGIVLATLAGLEGLAVYPFALAGAALGAFTAFSIVNVLPRKTG